MAVVAILTIVLLIVFGMSASAYRNKTEGERVFLKLIYTFLIGIFLAVFVGVGVAAFYPGPKYPEQSVILKYCSPEMKTSGTQSDECKSEFEKFDKDEKLYQKQSQIYDRNVSIIAIIASIIIVVASLTFLRNILLIADGFLLGGLLTLIYGVMRGFGTEDNMFRFVVVSVGLFVSLFLGYVKFSKPTSLPVRK